MRPGDSNKSTHDPSSQDKSITFISFNFLQLTSLLVPPGPNYTRSFAPGPTPSLPPTGPFSKYPTSPISRKTKHPMGKRTDAGSWKKFKRSFSHLSLAGRSASDLTSMNVRQGRASQDSHTDRSSEFEFESQSDSDRASDRDRESTPLFSSSSTVDLHLDFQAWSTSMSMSRPASMAIMGPIPTTNPTSNSNPTINTPGPNPETSPGETETETEQGSGPPPRSDMRMGEHTAIALPPRKHPYPSSLAASFRAYHRVASPGSLRRFFFGRFHRKRRTIFPRRVAGSSLASASVSAAASAAASASSARGLAGLPAKIRRALANSASRLRRRAPRVPPSANASASSGESDSDSDASSLEVLSDADDTLYSRVVKAAHEMNFDDSTVGSLIMIVGEDCGGASASAL